MYERGDNKISIVGLQIQDLTFLAHSTNTGDDREEGEDGETPEVAAAVTTT
jgi:hypothetical protein